MSLQEIRKIRLKKLKNILKAGLNPYPSKTERSLTILEANSQFSSLVKKGKFLILNGRIRSIRFHGGSTFAHIEDGSGKIQIYLKQDILKEKYKFFIENFDIGDFIEAKGKLFKTRKGEKTLEVFDYRILAKSLRPLPEKWHGLKDIEERFRKRYLDLIFNPEIRQKFELRSKIIRLLREFLEKNGFIEVETPILQPMAGGATARPFKTHLNALNLDLYLRIAPELYLKRLLIGGFEKIYEIARCFRNEGIDFSHNPDFTMLEFYWAYADYFDLMKMAEEMFKYLLRQLKKQLLIEYQGNKIDFKKPWPKKTLRDLLIKEIGIDIDKATREELLTKSREFGVQVEEQTSNCKLIDEIYKKVCRPKIIQPTFILGHPIEMAPLAKALDSDPTKAARFQIVIGGIELVNAYSELNNPIEQKRRFQQQRKLRDIGDKEAQLPDQDFLEALEYGLPPAAGFGLGIDRLVALLTDSHSLREVILFPTMKPKEK